jgi:tetratricopeptide (TPR) repeat protein
MNELTNFLNGHITLNKGQFEDSLIYFQTVLETDRENPESWYNVGLLFVYLGDYDRAIHHYDKALELDPHDEFIAEARHIARQKKYLYKWNLKI